MNRRSAGHKNRFRKRKTEFSSEKISLSPRAWVNLGYSIANTEESTFFLKNAIPGEEVEAIVSKKKGTLYWGIASEFLQTSPKRITSDCAAYPRCGGCSYRHIDYETELEVKRFLLQETLERSFSKKGISIPPIEILCADPIGYRNTAQIRLGFSGSKRIAGFYEEFSHSIVALPPNGCLNLPKEMNDTILKRSSREKNRSSSVSKSETLSYRMEGKRVVQYRNESVKFKETIRVPDPVEIEWEIPAGGFSQVNRFLIPLWLEKIYDLVSHSQNRILEFYCGSGLISIALASKCEVWSGYELSPESVEQAGKNARLNRSSVSTFHRFSVLDLETESVSDSEDLNSRFWILNPPRSGLSGKVLDTIAKNLPDSFLYSSCNHTTLARDLAFLLETGYELSDLVLVDFFPRTKHFEVIAKAVKPDYTSSSV
ncbi:class I SAM-dependent RNA methyltransferase [Leptospira gomenensis]|uniref:Class I SAM-dependent RNA methyltransferase n=1 Tax=Leptospira gomenensis TaxID=2484974 RepID=A0A5F1YQV2_9LEPT|nr:class I SAM-dependent RNA methyltransferase [Leptospira gomenensis]TGK28078.1 class I SAM-dependent RNA methyltransferase [Leptospira gomenensis]TGK37066.1 class I SAM-dependent RNA methyltransferase [Leptospira gomenensis]TGK45702.1 class I SAM-dependent RNA methyltransferase [Leptospira gomenensis]TGK59641.1 class I SAM-dependent RNA methyltransferase [Leptospira gomenensis]